jgi:uncharacterized membrane protein/plastocyanin
MDQEIFEWLLLLGRWVHITTAITWIGTSIFFMWLDRTFTFNPTSKSPGHVGDLWMVHGGGFYHVEKLQMGPTKVPEHLHWFKWESYWTWMSGMFLMLLIFYSGSGTFLLDSSISKIGYWPAVAIGVASVLVSWIFYDLLWESKLTKSNPLVGHVLTLIWFAAVSYFLCRTLSGRAAYMHIGAMIGTWMTANVAMRIIPRQVKMVEASKKGETVNQDWGKNAKNRSTHNTYFTLPVIFIMLSNHFPSTYGNRYNWIILLFISAGGAAVREYFVSRLSKPARANAFGLAGVLTILIVIFSTRENVSSSNPVLPSTDSGLQTQAPLGSGQVRGTAYFEGTPPKGEKIILPPGCSEGVSDVYADDVIVKNGRLKNVLVRMTKGLEGKTFGDVPQEHVIVDQKHCMYLPRLVAVRVGQTVEFVNSDPTFHNVRTVTKNNEDFNVAMPSQNQRIEKVFTKPEIVLQTKCSVHPWMTANIAVVEHPFFDVTDDAGEFSISNLPPGSYTLELWHETLGTQSKDFVIKEAETTNFDFTFKP